MPLIKFEVRNRWTLKVQFTAAMEDIKAGAAADPLPVEA